MFNSIATNHRNHTVRFRVTDQTESAIIYVAVVVVFYAAIIILLLGTNSRRPHRSRSRTRNRASVTTPLKDHLKQPTVAVYVDDHNRTEVQVQTENDEVLSHQLCVETLSIYLRNRTQVKSTNNHMADRDRLLHTTKINLKGLLTSSQSPILVSDVPRHYEDVTCQKLPYRDLGYTRAEDFFKSLRDIVRIERSNRGDVLVAIRDPSSASDHIQRLVQEQKSNGRGGKKLSNRRPFIRSNFPRERQVQQTRAKPLKSLLSVTPSPSFVPPSTSWRNSVGFPLYQQEKPRPYLLPTPCAFGAGGMNGNFNSQPLDLRVLQRTLQQIVESHPHGLTFLKLQQEFCKITNRALSLSQFNDAAVTMEHVFSVVSSSVGLCIEPVKTNAAGEEILKLLHGKDHNRDKNQEEKIAEINVEDGNLACKEPEPSFEPSVKESTSSSCSSRSVKSKVVQSDNSLDTEDNCSVAAQVTTKAVVPPHDSQLDPEVRENLRKVMVKCKNGIFLYELPTEYETISGKELKFGNRQVFSNIYELINAARDVLYLHVENKREAKLYPAWLPPPSPSQQQSQNVDTPRYAEIVTEDKLRKMLEVVNSTSCGVHLKVFNITYEHYHDEVFELNDKTCGSSLEAVFTKLSQYFNQYYVGANGNILVKCSKYGQEWLKEHSKHLSKLVLKPLPYVLETPEDAVTSCDERVDYPNDRKFNVGNNYVVNVCSVHSPEKFCIQLEEQIQDLDNLHIEMNDTYENKETSHKYMIDSTKIRVGLPCAAYFEELNVWNRAWITAIYDKGNVDIHYYDYGNTSLIHVSQLRFLRKEFLIIPTFCWRAKLANIEGKYKGRWDVQGNFLFSEIALTKTFRAKIVKTGNPLHLELYRDSINLSEVLVAKGVAKSVPINDVVSDAPPSLISPSNIRNSWSTTNGSLIPTNCSSQDNVVSPSRLTKFGKDVSDSNSSNDYNDIQQRMKNLEMSSDSDNTTHRSKLDVSNTSSGSNGAVIQTQKIKNLDKSIMIMQAQVESVTVHVVRLNEVAYIPTLEVSRCLRLTINGLKNRIAAVPASVTYTTVHRDDQPSLFDTVYGYRQELPRTVDLIRLKDLPVVIPKLSSNSAVIEGITAIAEWLS
ncbi:Tdrd5p [Chamberlinius hualienensis]